MVIRVEDRILKVLVDLLFGVVGLHLRLVQFRKKKLLIPFLVRDIAEDLAWPLAPHFSAETARGRSPYFKTT